MRVLLGTGGSEDSIRALEVTVERAIEAGDDLTIAIVGNPATDATREEIEAKVRRVLSEAELDASVQYVEGDPGSRLVDIAEGEGYDQLVLGGGRTSPMGKIQVGNIAEFVLLNSHVTVKLVR
ncbi:MAG: universal stress protein [Halobacteriota archaeon]